MITLKNLYRILTVKDYPVFSNGVFPSRYKSGITLSSFWNQNILPEFKSGIYGRNIWDKSQHTYFSRLCNRKEGLPYFEEYSKEIFEVLNADTLLAQIIKIQNCFEEHHYNSEVFHKKVSIFIQLCQNDPFLSRNDLNYLLKQFAVISDSDISASFYDAWSFTVLLLIALCADNTYSNKLIRWIQDEKLNAEYLYSFNKTADSEMLLSLRNRNVAVFGKAEEQPFFFGRESELYELMEAVRHKAKVFVSGIGGIGKTELLRQLVYYCGQNRKYTNIISVVYESTLPESFKHVFSDNDIKDADELFHDALYQIKTITNDSVILFIDNADIIHEETVYWKELSDLPCPVIVTSRNAAPDGFDELKLNSLDARPALLLLRRYYQNSFSRKEQDQLLDAISSHTFYGHPLTLKLFACYAREKSISIEQLSEMILKVAEENHADPFDHLLQNIYRNLYETSNLKADQLQIVSIISFIHYRQYSLSEIHSFCLRKKKEEVLEKHLEELVQNGWLEKKADQYSMHPLIAECIRNNSVSEESIHDYLDYAQSKYNEVGDSVLLSHYKDSILINEIGFNLLRICRSNSDLLTDKGIRLLIYLLSVNPKSYVIKEEDYRLIETCVNNIDEADTELKLSVLLLGIYNAYSDDTELLFKLFEQYIQESDDENRIYFIGDCVLEIMPVKVLPLEQFRYLYSLIVSNISNTDHIMTVNLKCILHCCTNYFKEEGESVINKTLSLIEETNYSSLSDECETKTGIFYFFKAYFEILFGDFKQARTDYDKGLTYRNKQNAWGYTAYELRFGGILARLENHLEEAEQILLTETEMEARYLGHYSLGYLSSMGERAVVLSALGRDDEAIRIYEEIIPSARSMQIYTLPVWINNLGVAYLGKKEYEKAKECFRESIELVKGDAPIKTAEPEYNLSKIYRAENNIEVEIELLNRCEPVFAEVYGDTHPKTVYVRDRLEEIKKMYEEE